MDTKPTIKNFIVVILSAITIVFIIFFLVIPQVRENRKEVDNALHTNESVVGLPSGAGDLTTKPAGLRLEQCIKMGGRAVNTVGGNNCSEDEILVGDVIGFISPNICCLPDEAISQIDSFGECADAGFFIMESYPMQCRTPDDRIFTQEIVMSEKIARSIAEISEECKSKGVVGDLEVYNTNTKTWWFVFEPNEPKQGCKPACVVSEETETAKINWRCTGLIVK